MSLSKLIAVLGAQALALALPQTTDAQTAQDRPLQLSETTVYQVGGMSAPEWALFDETLYLAFGSDGRLHVLDASNHRSVVIDRSGELAWEYGRRGGGPGEFQTPASLTVMDSGAQVIADMGNRSLVVVAPDGARARSMSVDLDEGFPSHPLIAVDHEVMARVGGDLGPGPEEPYLRAFATEAPGWRPVFTPWFAEDPRGSGEALDFGGTRIRIRVPGVTHLKGWWPSVMLAPTGGGVALVDSTDYRIRVLQSDGSTARISSRDIVPTPVTGRMEDRERRRRMDAIESGQGPRLQFSSGDGEVSPVDAAQVAEFMADQIEGMIFWEEVPVVYGLVGFTGGPLLVQRWATDGSGPGAIDWWGPDGTYAGTLPEGSPLPEAIGPDGLAAFLSQDDLGIPIIRVVTGYAPGS